MTVLSNIITPSNVLTTTNTATVTNKTLTSPAVTGMVVSDGTANGVTYLNGSKVLTSGSALTFDGSNLSTTGQILLNNNNYVGFKNTSGSPSVSIFNDTSNFLNLYNSGNTGTIFYVNAAEQMRLTSTGLGIGTSSPASKLHVGVVGGGVIARFAHTGETNNPYAYFKTNEAGNLASLGSYSSGGNSALGFLTADTERMRLDSAGNVGIGTSSPSAKLDVAGSAYVRGDSTDATFTSAGQLAIKRSSSDPVLSFHNNTGGQIGFIQMQNSGTCTIGVGVAQPLAFNTNGTERARIDSSGNLFVGTTSQITNEKLSIDTGNTVGIGIKTTGGASNSPIFSWNATTSGDGFFAAFATETSLTVRGSITYNRTAGLTSYNTTSDYRAKDIYGPVSNSGALIDSIPVYMGKMKGATQERPMFIAHETPVYAHTGVKDAVDADGNPVYQQMDASALIPVMWAEIQSLRQRLSAANL